MDARDLISALQKKLGTNSQVELAQVLGITVQTLINWKKKGESLSPTQVANALSKSTQAAIKKSQYEAIRPLVEYFRIKKERRGAVWSILSEGGNRKYIGGLKKALEAAHGLYVFYDSSGSAIYVGKAKKSSLWKEMNLAFNRTKERDVQRITLVEHPERNQEFKPNYEKLRQPKGCQLSLDEMAFYFSAYAVDDGMIDDMEALLIRSFANHLLNVRMETFVHNRE